MKRWKSTVAAVAFAGTFLFSSAAYAAGGMPVTVAYAHGHHSSGHHSSGHHSSSTSYYYCGGHDAHTHHNGVCPYASSVSNNTVKRVQKKLNSCGYNCGTADGVLGTKTKRALKKFQRDNDLRADGVIGQQTLVALGLA